MSRGYRTQQNRTEQNPTEREFARARGRTRRRARGAALSLSLRFFGNPLRFLAFALDPGECGARWRVALPAWGRGLFDDVTQM